MTDPLAPTGAQTAATGNGAEAASGGWSLSPDSSTATLDHPVSQADVPGRGPVIPGHVSIAPRVLQKVGGAVVADTLEVDRRDVRVDARDDAGSLALRVSAPIKVPALTAGLVVAPGGVLGTVRSLQETVTRRLFEITGRAVSRVDVTVTGSRLQKTGGLQ